MKTAPYRLYGRSQTGVMAIEAAFGEAGIAYEYVVTPKPTTEADIASFRRLNPRLQVPVLVHPDGTAITEGPAILSHIADSHPGANLIPKPGTTARARHDRWVSFFHANVYEGMLRELFPDRYTSDAEGAAAVKSAASDYVRRHFVIFEAELGSGPYLSGDDLAVFDIYLWMLCYWMDEAWLTANCPRIANLWRSASARPVLARIAESHFG